MDTPVHLLTTPPEFGAIARLMQKLGRNHVGQFNNRYQRTGTLWEDRCKASLADSESWALHWHHPIDPNPVRAHMTGGPTTCPWLSYASHCDRRQEAILTPYPKYTTLAATPQTRVDTYRQLLHETLADDDLKTIRTYPQPQRALGRDDSRAMAEARTQHSVGISPRTVYLT